MVAGTLREARLSARSAGVMDSFPDLPDSGDWLDAIGKNLQICMASVEEVVWAEDSPFQALRRIRAQGTNQVPFRPARFLQPGEMGRLSRAWQERFSLPDQQVSLTYRVLYVVARAS
jgi:hypothetical protein